MDYTSDHFNGKIFLNPVPTEMMQKGTFFKVLRKWMKKHPGREPVRPLGPFKTDLKLLNALPPDALRVTWLGHSTTLIEIDGKRFLTDPLWYERASPFKRLGPKRFFANPLPIDKLPHIDYILLSHDHYDHLDKASLLYLTNEKKIPVITMFGVGKRLLKWGVNKLQITELDWWWNAALPDKFMVTATPARHFSGRWLSDRFKTLWGAFVIRGTKHKVFYGADSGYFNGFKTIGERLGPFDLTMLEIGAYGEDWPTIHMGPDGAIKAQLDLGSGLLMPLHWGTFSLAFHPWKEPIEKLMEKAKSNDISLLLPRPGETVDVSKGAYNSRWWEDYR